MRTPISVLALLLLAAPVFAQTGRQSVDVYPKAGAASGVPATLSFAGRLHQPAKRVALPAAGAVSLAPAEVRLVDYVGALARGGEEDILSFWSPAERAAAAERVEGNVSRIRSVFRSVDTLVLHGEVAYGPYLLVLAEVRLGERVLYRRYPFERVGDELFLTDALAGDPVFRDLVPALLEALAQGRAQPSARPATGTPQPGLRVRDDEIRYGLLPADGDPVREVVELVLRGEVYPEGEPLVGPRAAAETDDDALSSLRRAFDAWRNGTYGDVLALWAPDQQDRFTRYFPPESFAGQRRIFQLATGVRLLARLRYGDFEIVVVEIPGAPDEAAGRAYAVRAAAPERWWTYELLDDPIFDLWRESLAERLAKEIGVSNGEQDEGTEAGVADAPQQETDETATVEEEQVS